MSSHRPRPAQCLLKANGLVGNKKRRRQLKAKESAYAPTAMEMDSLMDVVLTEEVCFSIWEIPPRQR